MTDPERLEFTKNSLEYFAHVYERGELQSRIPELVQAMGYTALNAQFSFDISNYKAVLPKSGVIDYCDEKSEAIPVITLLPGEKIEFLSKEHPFHSRRKLKPIAIAVEKEGDETLAMVAHYKEEYEQVDGPLMFSHRPILTFIAYPPLREQGRTCPTVVGHEFMHIAQRLATGVEKVGPTLLAQKTAFRLLQDELEAYSLQAAMLPEIMYDFEPVLAIEMALQVEAYRKKYSPEGFVPNYKLVAALVRNRSTSSIVPEGLFTDSR